MRLLGPQRQNSANSCRGGQSNFALTRIGQAGLLQGTDPLPQSGGLADVNNPGLGPRIVPALFIEWNTCQLGLEIINRILDCGRCVNEARTRRNVKPWPCGIAETRMAETRGDIRCRHDQSLDYLSRGQSWFCTEHQGRGTSQLGSSCRSA